MEKQRIDYLDTAKCLAVLCVGLGFAFRDGIVAAVLASVTFPLLFFTSGVFISRHRHTDTEARFFGFLKHNAESLVCPYIVFALLYGSLTLDAVGKIVYASEASLSSASVEPILWYIPCLFVAKLFMEVFLTASARFEKIDRRIFSLAGAGVSFLIGFLLPRFSFGYIWSADIAFVALGFMLVGYAVKDYLSDIISRSSVASFAVAVLSAGFFALTFVAEGGEVLVPDMGRGEFGQVFLYLLRAFMGIGCLISLSMLLTSLIHACKLQVIHSAFVWLSRNLVRVFLLLPLANRLLSDAVKTSFAGRDILLALGAFILAILIAAATGILFPKEVHVPTDPAI